MGPALSISQNTINNHVKATMDSVLTSRVEGDLNVACSNKQLIEGARGCQINFADQICKAVGISNMTSNTSLDAQLTQDITNQITSAAASSVEGLSLQLAQLSSSSNYIMNSVGVAMNTNMSFSTSCTRNLSAINDQTIRDCENSTVNFAAQDVSGEVIGDCVANQVGSLAAAQQLTNVMDIEATSQTKGVDLWAMVLMGALFFLFFILGGPIFLYGMRYASTARTNNRPIDPTAKGRFRAAMLLLFGMLIVAIVWWPFGFSIFLGIAPWSYLETSWIGDNCDESTANCRQPACFLGSSVDKDLMINRFMWYDPHCASYSAKTFDNPDGQNRVSYCDTSKKMKHYQECGLFAKTFGCDDPEFLKDQTSYVDVLEACGADAIAGATFKTCSPGDIATEMFAVEEDSYGDCHKCVGTSAEEKALVDPRTNYGLWAEKGKSCATGISKTAYIRGEDPCSASDPDCKENEEDFLSVSRNECTHSAYHQRKQRFSEAYKACQRVQEVSRITEYSLGKMPFLSQQCPPNPFEYFSKCNGASKECSYIASGCVCDKNGENCDCSRADERIVQSCQNDMMACCQEQENGAYQCRDPQLQADMNVWKAADMKCQEKQDAELKLHPWGWVIPLIFYILGFLYIAWILTRNPSVRQIAYGGWNAPQTQKTANWVFLLMGICCILAAGWPVGVLAVVHAGGTFSMYERDFKTQLKGFNDSTASQVGYAVMGVGILLFLFGVYRIFIRKTPTPIQTAQPIPTAKPAPVMQDAMVI